MDQHAFFLKWISFFPIVFQYLGAYFFSLQEITLQNHTLVIYYFPNLLTVLILHLLPPFKSMQFFCNFSDF